MTNREKYYSTNRQLAEELVGSEYDQYCSHCPITGARCDKLYELCKENGDKRTTENCIEEIEKWLGEECDDNK